MTKRLIFLTILCTVMIRVVSAQGVHVPEDTWLQDGTKWSKAPRELNAKLSFGRATILYFAADHTFSLIYATVNRVPGEYDVICSGCGQVVYSGSWELVEKNIKVKYRLISRTVLVAGEQLPGPVKEDAVRLDDDAVVFLGRTFHRSTTLDASVREFIPPATR